MKNILAAVVRRDSPWQQRLLIVCISLSALSAGAAHAQSQGKAPARDAIVRALRTGDYANAVALATNALDSTPRDCALLSLRALAFSGLQQTQPALQSFQKALDICPAYLPALEGAAQIEFAGRDPRATIHLAHIIAIRPEDPTAHAMLASMLQARGDCRAALPHFQSSEVLFPSRPDLQQGYSSCLAATGSLLPALAQYQSLLTTHPNDTIRYDVALLQWRTHANQEALTTLAPLLSDSGHADALALASKIHEELGETPQAVALLREAILRAPDDVDNYLDFTGIAFAHQSFQVGIDVLNVGLKRKLDSAPLYIARGVLEVQLSRINGAIADFEQAHHLDPKLSISLDALGIIESQQHHGAESLAIFQAQAKQHPDDPLLQYLLAEQLAESPTEGHSEVLNDAIEAAKRAVALDPAYLGAHDLLTVLYMRAKQPRLAIQQAELALAIDGDDQIALYQQMLARRRTGETQDAAKFQARFDAVRRAAELKQGKVDRFRLQDDSSHDAAASKP